ncbi:hypothetical protein C8R43DRAFT_965736 [Mycena crocata]|nr:hypothetical protein C8R43DRAFT_965736 [Mycena crocata]
MPPPAYAVNSQMVPTPTQGPTSTPDHNPYRHLQYAPPGANSGYPPYQQYGWYPPHLQRQFPQQGPFQNPPQGPFLHPGSFPNPPQGQFPNQGPLQVEMQVRAYYSFYQTATLTPTKDVTPHNFAAPLQACSPPSIEVPDAWIDPAIHRESAQARALQEPAQQQPAQPTVVLDPPDQTPGVANELDKDTSSKDDDDDEEEDDDRGEDDDDNRRKTQTTQPRAPRASSNNAKYGYVVGAMRGKQTAKIFRRQMNPGPHNNPGRRLNRTLPELMSRAERLGDETGCYMALLVAPRSIDSKSWSYISNSLRLEAPAESTLLVKNFMQFVGLIKTARRTEAMEITRSLQRAEEEKQRLLRIEEENKAQLAQQARTMGDQLQMIAVLQAQLAEAGVASS